MGFIHNSCSALLWTIISAESVLTVLTVLTVITFQTIEILIKLNMNKKHANHAADLCLNCDDNGKEGGEHWSVETKIHLTLSDTYKIHFAF